MSNNQAFASFRYFQLIRLSFFLVCFALRLRYFHVVRESFPRFVFCFISGFSSFATGLINHGGLLRYSKPWWPQTPAASKLDLKSTKSAFANSKTNRVSIILGTVDDCPSSQRGLSCSSTRSAHFEPSAAQGQARAAHFEHSAAQGQARAVRSRQLWPWRWF